MKSSKMSAIALPVVLIAAAVTASPALAHGMAMGQGFGSAAPCYGQHGMMGPGMMGQGMGPGMMGQGMGPSMMGQSTGPGMMGQGMGSPSGGTAQYRDRDLTVDEVKSILEHRLEHNGNERLRVGKVEEKDDDVIIAEVETVDGSLVERYAVDRHTGRMQRSK
jgi:hypothetical protein